MKKYVFLLILLIGIMCPVMVNADEFGANYYPSNGALPENPLFIQAMGSIPKKGKIKYDSNSLELINISSNVGNVDFEEIIQTSESDTTYIEYEVATYEDGFELYFVFYVKESADDWLYKIEIIGEDLTWEIEVPETAYDDECDDCYGDIEEETPEDENSDETVEQEKEPEEIDNKEEKTSNDNLLLYIIISVSVTLNIVFITLLILKNKKQHNN